MCRPLLAPSAACHCPPSSRRGAPLAWPLLLLLLLQGRDCRRCVVGEARLERERREREEGDERSEGPPLCSPPLVIVERPTCHLARSSEMSASSSDTRPSMLRWGGERMEQW